MSIKAGLLLNITPDTPVAITWWIYLEPPSNSEQGDLSTGRVVVILGNLGDEKRR